MARIRTIKPDFFTSEDIVALSPLARLLYIATWLEADREGRMIWRPGTMRLRYFPGDQCAIEVLTAELVDARLVVLYDVDGRQLAHIPTFARHQVVNNRESPSTLPAPRDVALTRPARVGDASATREHATVTPLVGREGNGKEGKEDAQPTPDAESIDRRSTGPGAESDLGKANAKAEKVPSARKRPAASPDRSLFDEFWKPYPRKDGRKEAKKAFDKLNPSEDTLAVMLAAIRRQVASEDWKKDGGKFIPYPATWLNGERWTDQGVQVAAAANTDYAQTQARLAREAQRGQTIQVDPSLIAAAKATAQAARVRSLEAPRGPRPIGTLLPAQEQEAA